MECLSDARCNRCSHFMWKASTITINTYYACAWCAIVCIRYDGKYQYVDDLKMDYQIKLLGLEYKNGNENDKKEIMIKLLGKNES